MGGVADPISAARAQGLPSANVYLDMRLAFPDPLISGS